MSDVIDLDFYRKFRVILPIHAPDPSKSKSTRDASPKAKIYHRRRKMNPATPAKTEKKSPN